MYNEHLTTVAQFPDVFSADECRWLIDLPVPSGDAGVQVRNSDNVQDSVSTVAYEFRRTRVKPIPPEQPYAWVYQRLRGLVWHANAQAFRFHLGDEMTVEVLEYDPAGFFDWHVDIGAGFFSTRKLSMVTFLTSPDEYEGGDLCFMDRGGPMRLARGARAIFPSYLLHKVEPVTRGCRHTMVSWAHGPSFA